MSAAGPPGTTDSSAPALAPLAALAAQWGLSRAQRTQLARLLALLADDPYAPTTVRDPAEAVGVHIADSLTALDLAPVRAARRIADLGSGAGFPGLPLAIALPHARVSLLESSSRKCRFLEGARDASEAANAEVVCGRAETWTAGRQAHDLIVARAVGPAPVVAEYAAPLLAPGGALVDWRGATSLTEDRAALAAAAMLGLHREAVRPTQPYAAARHLHLHVYVKVRDTPLRYPRRAGIARKRPLPT